jgi:hypothetical protein
MELVKKVRLRCSPSGFLSDDLLFFTLKQLIHNSLDYRAV